MDQDELLVILSNALARKASKTRSMPFLDQELWPRLVNLVSHRFLESPAMSEGDIEFALLEERENLLTATGFPSDIQRQLRQAVRQRVAEEWPALFALLHTHRYLLLKRQYKQMLEEGDAQTLLTMLGKVAGNGQGGAEEYIHLARNLHERGDRSQALVAVRQGLTQYPNHPVLTRELARHYQRSGFLSQATNLLRQSLEEYEDPHTRKVLGSVLLSEGLAEEAARVWTDLRHQMPELLDPLEIVQLATALEDASSESSPWWEVLEKRIVPATHGKIRGAFEELLTQRRLDMAKS